MKKIFETLLPDKADNTVRGMKFPFYVLILIAFIGTVRSFIHLLASDGGAGSIAGMDLSVQGASSIIFVFAQWGGTQLIYAFIQWLVIFRYRSLVPFMWAVQFLETLLRILAGHLKPATFAHTPPGEIGNYIYLPLAVLMLVLSLWSANRQVKKVA
jgi:hypothetical protein